MNKILMLTVIAGLVSSLSPALADEIVVRDRYVSPIETILTPPSVFMPTTTLSPVTTTTTTRQTTVSDAPLVETVSPDSTTTMRRTIITGAAAAQPACSSTKTTFTSDLGAIPIYGNRLAAMNQQIREALANGWLTQAQANSLLAQHDRLAAEISQRSTSRFDSDSLEKGLNGLNLSIQDAMNSTRSTAGLSQTR